MADGIENTDKYYKSKKPGSAFQQSAADSVRKPGKKLPPGYTPVVTPKFNTDDTTTDRYYREGGSKSGNAGQPVQAKLPYKAVDPAVAAGSHGVVLVEIPDAKFLHEGIASAKAAARQGNKVEVAVTKSELVEKVRVALDGAVTREEITEDQRREIRVGIKKQGYQTEPRKLMPAENRSPDEVFGAPIALGTREAATNDDPLDVDAFLAGGAKDDEDEKLAALTGGTAAGGTPPPPPAVEDNDFDLVGTTPSPEILAGGGPIDWDHTTPPPEKPFDPRLDVPRTAEDVAAIDRETIADLNEAIDLAKVPRQPKTNMGVPGAEVAKEIPEL